MVTMVIHEGLVLKATLEQAGIIASSVLKLLIT